MTKLLGTVAKGLGRRSVLLVVVAAASVASVGGISYALTDNTQSPPSASAVAPPVTATAASTTANGGVKGRIARILKRAVHLEVVVPSSGGGLRTIDADRGTVSTLTSTSITITPADGDAPITDAITTSTHQPKVPVSSGQAVLLVSSNGDALIIRHARSTTTIGATGSTSS